MNIFKGKFESFGLATSITLLFGVLVVLFTPELAFAVPPPPPPAPSATGLFSTFTPSSDDYFMRIFARIIGKDALEIIIPGLDIYPNVLYPSTTPFSELIKLFLELIMAAGSFMIAWTYVMASINTGQDGTFLGKSMDSVWVPLRTGISVLLIAPVPAFGGFSMIQAMAISAVGLGVGVADYGYNSMIDYYIDNQTKIVLARPTGGVMLAGKILKAEALYFYMSGDGVSANEKGVTPVNVVKVEVSSKNKEVDPTTETLITIGDNTYERNGITIPFIGFSFSSNKVPGRMGTLICDKNASNSPGGNLTSQSTFDDVLYASRYNMKINTCGRALDLVNGLIPFAKKIAEQTPLIAADVASILALSETFNVDSKNAAMLGVAPDAAGFKLNVTSSLKRDLKRGGFVMVGASYWHLAKLPGRILDLTTNNGVKFTGGTNYLEEEVDSVDSGDKEKLSDFIDEVDDFLRKSIGFNDPSQPGVFDADALIETVKSQYIGGITGDSYNYVNMHWFSELLQKSVLGSLSIYKSTFGSTSTHTSATVIADGEAIVLGNSFGFMSDIRSTGDAILTIGTTAMMVQSVVGSIKDGASDMGRGDPFTGKIIGAAKILASIPIAFAMLLMKLLTFLMVLGFTLAFIVPALPFMFVLIAVISYLIFFAEAIVALPLTAVGLAHPDGQGPLSQVSGKAVFLVLRLMAQPLIIVIAFAFAVEATDAVGAFVMAITLPSMSVAIDSSIWGWVGHLVILTSAILVTVFTIWEIIMGFTNQVFKWIGDVANDLGESKANQMFVGVAGGAKGASTGLANAQAMKGAMPGGGATGGDKKSGGSNENATQTESTKDKGQE